MRVAFAADHATATRYFACPSYYSDDPVLDRVFGPRPDNYLEDFGMLIDPAIAIYWTGEEVCSPEIGVGHVRDVVRAASDIFEENVSLLPVLDELHSRGITLVLLSNTCLSHFRFVAENYRVLERFDDVVLSCEVGHLKPEPEIFEAAVAAIGCPPDRCFYTDDIPEYVASARRFGLHAEVFEGTDQLLGHLARLGVEVPAGRGCTASAG